MKIWKVEYTYDMYLDGRMSEEIKLFTTKEKAINYVKSEYDFDGEINAEEDFIHIELAGTSEWDDESVVICSVDVE